MQPMIRAQGPTRHFTRNAQTIEAVRGLDPEIAAGELAPSRCCCSPGVLLPLDGAPGWLQSASDVHPLRYVVDAERVLFDGTFPVETVSAGLLAAAVTAALGLVVGVRTMNRSS